MFCATLRVYLELHLPKLLWAQRTTYGSPPQLVPRCPEVKQVPGLSRGALAQNRRRRMRMLVFPATVQCFRSPTAVIAHKAVPCRCRWDKACTQSQVSCFCKNKVTRPFSFSFFFPEGVRKLEFKVGNSSFVLVKCWHLQHLCSVVIELEEAVLGTEAERGRLRGFYNIHCTCLRCRNKPWNSMGSCSAAPGFEWVVEKTQIPAPHSPAFQWALLHIPAV